MKRNCSYSYFLLLFWILNEQSPNQLSLSLAYRKSSKMFIPPLSVPAPVSIKVVNDTSDSIMKAIHWGVFELYVINSLCAKGVHRSKTSISTTLVPWFSFDPFECCSLLLGGQKIKNQKSEQNKKMLLVIAKKFDLIKTSGKRPYPSLVNLYFSHFLFSSVWEKESQ